MSATITTTAAATEFAIAMAKEEHASGREPWEVIVNSVSKAAEAAGYTFPADHLNHMRQYLKHNILACVSPEVVSAVAASAELAEWATLPAGAPLPETVEAAIERSKGRGSRLPEIIAYMRIIAKMHPLTQEALIRHQRSLVSDPNGLMKYVMDNFG